MLDNVVVTALGISKKDRKLGYALTTVKGEEVQRANTISPITALQGKVAGLNINVMGASGVQSSPSIIIRGAKSLNKNNQPIFVIDGMVIETNTYDADGVDQGSQLKNLNPDDYESITVLKGAAATSFYGTRGANGAIVITSKKGQPGQGLGVTFNSTYQTQVIYRNGLPLQDVYGSGAIAFREGNFKPDGTQVATSFSFGPRMDGSMHPSVYDPAKLVPYSPQPNNWKTFFQNGAYINNNVALSGGSENVTYRFSYSNLRNDGTLPNNQVKRNNFDFRTTGRINNVFSVEAGATYAITDARNPYGQGRYYWTGGQNLGFLTYYSVPRNTDLVDWKANYRNADNSMKRYGYAQYDDVVNAAFNRFDNVDNNRKEKSLLANVLLKAQVTPWLDFSAKANFNSYRIFNEYKEKGSGKFHAGGSYSVGGDYKSFYNYLFMGHMSRTVSNLGIDFRLYNEYYGNGMREEYGAATNGGLIVPNVFTLSNSINDISTTRRYTYSTPNDRAAAVGGILNLSWKDYLNLELTGRNDWLSTLTYPAGVAGANNYSVFYPSANLSWAFTDTWRDAMPQWLSFGKLRASLAYVGKGTGAYETSFGSYTQGTVINADGASVVTASLQNANVLPNMNLKAELQRSIELGTNLSFLNDMVNFDFAWYRTNTFNQILRIPYVVETGYTQRLINAGNIQNQGIEVLLNVTPIRTKDLRWDMSVNFTRNRGKIIEFYPGIKQYEMMGDYDGAGVWAYEGGDFGVLTANASYRKRDPKTGLPILRVGPRDTSTDPETKHDFQTYSWVNSVFNADTPRVNIGRVEPNFLAGWNTNLRWKDLSLYVQLDARFGGYSYSEAYNYGMQRGNLLNTMKYRDQANGGVERTDTYTGQPVFDGAIPDAIFEAGQKSPINGKDIGGMTFREAYDAGLVEPWKAGNYYINTFGWGRYLDNGSVSEVSWVMLREVSLGYQLPRQLINKIHLKGAGLRFTARNLGYLYNGLEGGQNPESLQSNNPFNPMITGAVPFSRNYAVSINISL
jgi:iron complex outermembrane receptor protein